MGELHDKELGRHRWCFCAVYPLIPSAAAALAGGATIDYHLDGFVVADTITCFDCAGSFAEMRTLPCPVDNPYEQPTEGEPE